MIWKLLRFGRAGTRFFPETVIHLPDEPLTGKIYSAFFEQKFPTDLTIALLWLAANILAIYLPILNESPFRIILTLPGLLFIPGYCLIAVLFPKKGDIGLLERVMLSIGLSIAIVPLIGLGLNFTPWGIRLEPVLISITLFTLAMIVVAQFRRQSSHLKKGSRCHFPRFLDPPGDYYLRGKAGSIGSSASFSSLSSSL